MRNAGHVFTERVGAATAGGTLLAHLAARGPRVTVGEWEARIASGAVLAGFDAWERARVERGSPRYGQDMDDKTIPLEAGLKPFISYDKGCYVGQEVVARATFRGHVNRQLRRLAFEGAAPPAPGAVLRAGDKEVGRVTSVVRAPDDQGWIGLGYVHRDAAESALALEGGGAVRIR